MRNLPPNVMHPHGNRFDLKTYQPLYQWGDHKVVFYDGKLWDPSYKTVWNLNAGGWKGPYRAIG